MRALILILATVLFVAPAAAQDDWYGGLSGEAVFLTDGAFDSSTSTVTIEYEDGWGIAGFVGTRLTGTNFRFEGEIAYQQSDVSSFTNSTVGINRPATGDITSSAALLNGYYDFDAGMIVDGLDVYVGAGVGLTKIDASLTSAGTKLVDDGDTVMAWQLKTGLSYDLTQSAQILMSYRYFSAVDPTIRNSAGTSFEGEYDSHNVGLGLRVLF